MASTCCKICHISLELREIADRRSPHLIQEWQESADTGCDTCCVILKGFSLYLKSQSRCLQDCHDITLELDLPYDDFHVQLQALWHEKDAEAEVVQRYAELEFYNVEDELRPPPDALSLQSTWSPFLQCRHIASCASEAIETMRVSLQYCDAYHMKCYKGDTSLPTRVLQVQYKDCSTTISIFETSEVSPRAHGKYIALSHCWGGHQPVRLLSSNLDEYKRNIDLDILPPVFRDAVEVTRRLQVQYLWIDALCIVQDDPHDWEEESAKMDALYHNAYVTLMASDKEDATESFLDIEREEAFRGIRIPQRDPVPEGKGQPLVYIRLRGHDDGDSSPLHIRAWVFQEYIVSSRVIQFFDDDTIFHCNHGAYCECGNVSHRGYIDEHYFHDDYNLLRSGRQLQHFDHDFESIPDFEALTDFEYWCEIVHNYSRLKLTYEKDKLPALSGLAADFCSRSRSMQKYAAGLWEEEFAFWLDWRSALGEMTETYIAPSWSWASIKGMLSFGKKSPTFLKSQVRVVEISCQLKGRNPFGEVLSGYAVLRGPVVKSQLNLNQVDSHTGHFSRTESNVSLLSHSVELDVATEIVDIEQADGVIFRTARRRKLGTPLDAHLKEGLCTVWVMCLHTNNARAGMTSAQIFGKPVSGIEAQFLVFGQPENGHEVERLGTIVYRFWQRDGKSAAEEDQEIREWLSVAEEMTLKIV